MKDQNNFITLKMRMSNIQARLNRVSTITGKDIYFKWKKMLLKNCELKYLNKELNVTYVNEAEKICDEIERENGIQNLTDFRIKELCKKSNKEYEVVDFNSEHFNLWLLNKVCEFSKICSVTHEKSKENLYYIFTKKIIRYPHSIFEKFSLLSGEIDSDISIIFNDYWLKRIFISTVICATIGSV